MAVPASGQLSLRGIKAELATNNYNNTIAAYENVSLATLSTGGDGEINTANASTDRPNGVTPHNMSEFYSYDHDASSTTFLSTVMYYDANSAGNACSEEASTITLYYDSSQSFTGTDTIWYQDSSGDEEADTAYYKFAFTSEGYFYDGGEKEYFSCGRSERRLKYNIEFIGDSPMGIPMYHFNYKNESHGKGRFVGTMVDDLQRLGFEDSLFEENGEIWVNYHKLDVPFESVSI